MAIDEITPLGSAAPLSDLLAAAGEPLTLDERRLIVRQAQLMIDQLYVHLPLKRAMHAVDPVQRLRLLDRRLASYSDRRFHDEMISIFIGLRDLHTNYILPAPYAGRTAVLPFRIEAYESPTGRHYIVTEIASGFTPDPPFDVAVEVTHWNGIPIDRAVALNGERNGGSNADARWARGLASMTQRPMALLAAPDEDWVDLTFTTGGETIEQRFEWRVIEPPPAPSGDTPSPHADPIGGALGIDLLTEEVRRAQKTIFAPEAMALERTMAADGVGADLAEVSTLPDVFEFRRLEGSPDIGYLRIRTFRVGDLDAYMQEVQRILALLPQDGADHRRARKRRRRDRGRRAAAAALHAAHDRARAPALHQHAADARGGHAARLRALARLDRRGGRDRIAVLRRAPARTALRGDLQHVRPALLRPGRVDHRREVLLDDRHLRGRVPGPRDRAGRRDQRQHRRGRRERLDLRQRAPGAAGPLRAAAQAGLDAGGHPPDHAGRRARRRPGRGPRRRPRRRRAAHRPRPAAAQTSSCSPVPPRCWPSPAAGAHARAHPHPGSIEVAFTTKGVDRVDVYVDGRPVATADVADARHTQTVAAGAGSHQVELRAFAGGELVACRKEISGE
jgi:hypothetical protein